MYDPTWDEQQAQARIDDSRYFWDPYIAEMYGSQNDDGTFEGWCHWGSGNQNSAVETLLAARPSAEVCGTLSETCGNSIEAIKCYCYCGPSGLYHGDRCHEKHNIDYNIVVAWIALFVGAFQLVRIFGRGGLARSVTRLQDQLLRLTLQRTRHVWECEIPPAAAPGETLLNFDVVNTPEPPRANRCACLARLRQRVRGLACGCCKLFGLPPCCHSEPEAEPESNEPRGVVSTPIEGRNLGMIAPASSPPPLTVVIIRPELQVCSKSVVRRSTLSRGGTQNGRRAQAWTQRQS